MARKNEKPMKIEVGVLDWIKEKINEDSSQKEFAEMVGMRADHLNAKLNGRLPLFKSEWTLWFKTLMGYDWDDRFNDIPEDISEADYWKKVREIRYGDAIKWDKFPYVEKIIAEAIFDLTGKRLMKSECENFIKYLSDRYIELVETELED
ncbi:MAG: hypothetical protein ACTSYW_00630 [Candidatus Heimdallarchaeota archaeon]